MSSMYEFLDDDDDDDDDEDEDDDDDDEDEGYGSEMDTVGENDETCEKLKTE